MLLPTAFLLSGTMAVTIDWTAGFTDASARTLTVKPGETLTFEWSGNSHNVYSMTTAAEDCNFDGATMISSGNTGPAEYPIPEDATDGTVYWFACDVTSHCSLGQHLTVTVDASNTFPQCEKCTQSTFGAIMNTDCEQFTTKEACQGTGGTTAQPYCYWRGEDWGNTSGNFYGPNCNEYDANCVPCVYRNTADTTSQVNAVCSPYLDMESCNAQPSYGQFECHWAGYSFGENCPGDEALDEFGKAIATWIWVVVVISVLSCCLIVCLIAVCCGGLTLCCCAAAQNNKGQTGGVNKV